MSENERSLILRKLRTVAGEDQQPLVNQLAGRMMDSKQPDLDDPVTYCFWLIKHHMAGEAVLTSFSTRDYRHEPPGKSRTQQRKAVEAQVREVESKVSTIRTMLEHAHAANNPALKQQLQQSLDLENEKLRELQQAMHQCAQN